MRVSLRSFLIFLALVSCALGGVEPPVEWVEPATGHRVVRLSREAGSASLYFHQNAYSADGRKLVLATPGGLATVNLETREIEQVVEGRVGVMVTGRKTGQLFYTRDGTIFATDLETKMTREIAQVPPGAGRGNIAVNADETEIVGIAGDAEGSTVPRVAPAGESGGKLEARWATGRAMMIYTVQIATGEMKVIHRENDWTNHLQCSPTDPRLVMFCHEGPWHFVDRIWTVRDDGTALRLMHRRTMQMEIAGHEFFSTDGKVVWYDLQTPKSGVFWLAGVDLATGARTQYHVERNEWSVHYNASPDGRFFAGDGGGPGSVANRAPDGRALEQPGNGQWIYLFHPRLVHGAESNELIKTGWLEGERLVDLSKHNYDLEPNVTFTPDGKWVVFRSNMHGATHTYAVEVAKTGVVNAALP